MFPNITFLARRWTVYSDWLWCISITILGAVLRLHNYDSFPPDNWTADEYAFAWSGMSLIQDHLPTSWSWLSPYQDSPVVVWQEKMSRYQLVTPWFDHPPLFGLIVGAAAILRGEKEFFACTLSTIRIPSLILGIASIILLYILSKKLSSTSVAVITSLIFATNPNTVFLSRLALSENLILPLSLAAILCFLKYEETGKNKYFYMAAIWAGITPLVKMTGLFLVGVLLALLLYNKKWKKASILLAIAGLGLLAYLAYGMIYDYELFRQIYQEQSARLDSRFGYFSILKYIILPNLFFEDAWLIFAWLTLLIFAKNKVKEKVDKIIIFSVVSYILLLILGGAQRHFWAWYVIPLYPFLFLSLGIFFDDLRKSPNFLGASLTVLLLALWCLEMNGGKALIMKPKSQEILILGLSFCLGVFFFNSIFTDNQKLDRLARGLAVLIFTAMIVANIALIYTYEIIG
jgi:4-amino-4-deoxy-L-arabinose transferase-like glycosyltransferase